MSFRRRLQIGNCRAFFEEAVSDRFPSSINDIRRLFLFYSRGKCRQPVARGADSGIRESQPLGRGMRCGQIASASGERDFFTNEMDWRPARYVFLYDPGSHIGRTAIRNYYLVGPARLTKQAIEEGAYGLFLIADWNNDANSHLLGPRVSSSGGQISFLAANQSSLNSARQSAFSFSFVCSRLSKTQVSSTR